MCDRYLSAVNRIGNRSICVGLVLLAACEHAHQAPSLPSHPIYEMFPRASSPPPDCPGQYRITMDNYNGSFFMGCWGNKSD
jgi:hypothetical protein